jgi:hypothetical protein
LEVYQGGTATLDTGAGAFTPEVRALAHAFLFALLLGLLMALASLVASILASTRLEKILLEAERLGEDLLDPFRPLPQTEEE